MEKGRTLLLCLKLPKVILKAIKSLEELSSLLICETCKGEVSLRPLFEVISPIRKNAKNASEHIA